MRKFRAKQEKIRKEQRKSDKNFTKFSQKIRKVYIFFFKKSYFVGNFNRLTKFSIYSTFF